MDQSMSITRQEQTVVAVAEQAASEGPEFTERALAWLDAHGLGHLRTLFLTAALHFASLAAGTTFDAVVRQEIALGGAA